MAENRTLADEDATSEDANTRAAGRDLKSGGSPLRLLCASPREPSWVNLTLGLSSAGIDLPRMVWVSTSREALARVREERFDCVIVDAPTMGALLGDAGGPIGLVRALRSAGCEEPVVLIGRVLTDADWADACALDCDVFVSPRGWDSTALGGWIQRAARRGELMRAHRQLAAAQHRRLLRERDESEQLLAQQRQIIVELEGLKSPRQGDGSPAGDGRRPLADPAHAGEFPPDDLVERYTSLVRSYVLMGSGSLAAETADIAGRLLESGVAPADALQLHLRCVEGLLKGLGNRSVRHVVARADLLAVELMTHVAQRSQQSEPAGARGTNRAEGGDSARESASHAAVARGPVPRLEAARGRRGAAFGSPVRNVAETGIDLTKLS